VQASKLLGDLAQAFTKLLLRDFLNRTGNIQHFSLYSFIVINKMVPATGQSIVDMEQCYSPGWICTAAI